MLRQTKRSLYNDNPVYKQIIIPTVQTLLFYKYNLKRRPVTMKLTINDLYIMFSLRTVPYFKKTDII